MGIGRRENEWRREKETSGRGRRAEEAVKRIQRRTKRRMAAERTARRHIHRRFPLPLVSFPPAILRFPSAKLQSEEDPERVKRLSTITISRLCLIVGNKFFPLLNLQRVNDVR